MVANCAIDLEKQTSANVLFKGFISAFTKANNCGGGAVGYSVGPANGRLGIRILAATDPSRKNR